MAKEEDSKIWLKYLDYKFGYQTGGKRGKKICRTIENYCSSSQM